MRGTHDRERSRVARGRIIPAYAGNTACRSAPARRHWDHPRICGEHSMLKAAANASTGSSPHMRGTPPFADALRLRFGIIPAYAGNTNFLDLVQAVHQDHPRICGEHLRHRRMGKPTILSSPHMRGTPAVIVCAVSPPGIIPAYAGNTGCS